MSLSVLIVDDDPLMRKLLAAHISSAGHTVHCASDGMEAMRVACREGPRLIVTDWDMPVMDGAALCKALRSHEEIGFVYIIVVTAHTGMESLVNAFEAGADDFIGKPVRREELMARICAGERIIALEENLERRRREIHQLNARLSIANDQLHTMATVDALTCVPNRRDVMDRLHLLWAEQDRYGQPFACIMVDIDHFKQFNDTYGHAVGDRVLCETAGVLRKSIRSTDIVGRIGGEEFLILCPNVDANGALQCAEHCRSAVESYRFGSGARSFSITISLGVAERTPETSHADDLVKRADDALYAAKRAGRNRVMRVDEIQLPVTAADGPSVPGAMGA